MGTTAAPATATTSTAVVIYLVIHRKTAIPYLQITYNFHTNHYGEIAEVWQCRVKSIRIPTIFTLVARATCVVLLASLKRQLCEMVYLL